jgi:hypothetical protein
MQQRHADLRLSGAVLAVAGSANAQLSAPIATPTFADVEAHCRNTRRATRRDDRFSG